MTMCTKALLGDPMPILDPDLIPCSSAVNSINNVLKIQKKFWPNLQYGMSLPKERLLPKIKTSNKLEERRNEKAKQTESKIVLEGLESEKLELNLTIDKNHLNQVTDEEILKLTNEVENIKIKNSKLNMIKNEADETKKNSGSKKNEMKNLDGEYFNKLIFYIVIIYLK